MCNMAMYNSRLHRTLEDVFEYNFVIKYRPGPLNVTPDALSRSILPIISDKSHDFDSRQLPKGFQLLKTIPGEGDSLFESLLEAINYEGEGKHTRRSTR